MTAPHRPSAFARHPLGAVASMLALAMLVVAASRSASAAEPSIILVGDLPGGSISAQEVNLSADGMILAGGGTSDNGFEAFKWTQIDGFTPLGDLDGGGFRSAGDGISPDGTVIVGAGLIGTSPWVDACGWNADGSIFFIGELPGGAHLGVARAVSNTGIVAGESSSSIGSQAFTWTSGGGFVVLPFADGRTCCFSSAWDISPDGTIVVGRSDAALGSQATRWGNGTVEALGRLPGAAAGSIAYAISADGQVIVGGSDSAASSAVEMEAFRWTLADGMVGLGALEGSIFASEAYDVSADGNVIVGYSQGDHPGGRAFIWDPVNGMRNLYDVLVDDYGLDPTGWYFNRAEAISDDGRTIAGRGAFDSTAAGGSQIWLVHLGDPIVPGDVNGDGVVNTQDLLQLLAAWGPCPDPPDLCPADVDGDGEVGTADLLALLAAWGPSP